MKPIRVLIVEDERIVALHLKQQLTRLGYAVVAVVSTGDEALSFLRHAHPDVVLMDINIEGDIDGIQTAALMTSDHLTPVIYLTAYSEDATLQRAAATNPYGYLLKPFSERELHATLQMAIAHSVSDRLTLEREKQFQDYAEMSSDWFWELDKNLNFKWMSCQPALREKIGEVASVGNSWNDMLREVATEPAVLTHLNALSAHESFRDFRFRRRDDKGRTFHFSVNGNPLYDSDHQFSGYRGTGRDVTHLIQFMNELQAAKGEAERSSKAKSDFVANMSHEFRTPLNAILGFSQIIQDEVYGPVQPPEYREYGGYIHDAGNHLLGLVNNVLDLSRIEAGHMELRREGVDIGCMISDCCTLVDGLAHKGGLILRNMAQQPLSLVEGDAIRLKQIILNLLSNAIKFTPPGGSIEIDARHNEKGSMVIRVSDTGCGMRPEDIQRAQEPFQRLEGAQTRRVEGTGLGLFLAKRLAELHEGHIDIASEPGQGTTVRVILPPSRILESNQQNMRGANG